MKQVYAYWWSNILNFGDTITPYLIEKISGVKPIKCSSSPTGKVLYAAGSILQLATNQSVIWGSGFIEEQHSPISVESIRAVRGPLTKINLDKLGITCPEVYGDPGILLPKYYSPVITKKFKVGVIPHYIDKDCEDLKHIGEHLIIDVQSSVEQVIDSMLSCDIILSSSLHGLIVADAYNIPTCWVKFSNRVYGNDFKFRDYYSSMNSAAIPVFNIEDGIKQAKLHRVISPETLLKAYPQEIL